MNFLYTPVLAAGPVPTNHFNKDYLKPKGRSAQSPALHHYSKGTISIAGTRTKANMDLQYTEQREQTETEEGSRRRRKRTTMWLRLFAVTDVDAD